MFLWAYERSAARYAAIRQTIGDPDPFRLRHRQALKQVISDVIREPMDKKAAARHIMAWARNHIDANERERFVEIAETELMGLHEGNFARYQVRPSEFEKWKAIWQEKSSSKKQAAKPPERR